MQDRRAELFAGWRMFLEGLSARRPLVVVIDDLQWADDGLLDFVDGLVDLVEGVPLFVVCCARPELLERRPDWGERERNALTVSLGPLSVEETQHLVESLLGQGPSGRGPPCDCRRTRGREPRCTPRSSSVCRRPVGRHRACRTASSESSRPESTSFRPPRRSCCATPRSWGRFVWSDGLRVVSGREAEQDVTDLLRSLGRKEFLRRERHSAVAGATQHAFVHTLVRDAVYAQLPRPDRVERHVRVARWIESLPEDRRRGPLRAARPPLRRGDRARPQRRSGRGRARARSRRGASRVRHESIRDRRLSRGPVRSGMRPR